MGRGATIDSSVAKGKVVALSGAGQLACFDTKTGKPLWKQHMMQDLGGEVNPVGGGPGSQTRRSKSGLGIQLVTAH